MAILDDDSLPLYMIQVDSQRYSFGHVQLNPLPMASSFSVASIMSTRFVIKL